MGIWRNDRQTDENNHIINKWKLWNVNVSKSSAVSSDFFYQMAANRQGFCLEKGFRCSYWNGAVSGAYLVNLLCVFCLTVFFLFFFYFCKEIVRVRYWKETFPAKGFSEFTNFVSCN